MEDKREKGFLSIFFPIFIETLFMIICGVVDTLMLSGVGDKQVGGVGAANTYLSLFTILFMVISSGMTAVVAQHYGKRKYGIASQAYKLGFIFNAVSGVLISFVLGFFAKDILILLDTAPELLESASTYMQAIGMTLFLNALIPICNSYLRCFKHVKEPLVIIIISNLLNVALNALFIFVLKWGVFGAAFATIISRVVNFIAILIVVKKKVIIPKYQEYISKRKVFGMILKIGIPSAFENALYNIGIIIITYMLNQMDPNGINMTVRSYANQMSSFSYAISLAFSSTNILFVGWLVGKGEYEKCYKMTNKVCFAGIISSATVASLIAIFCEPIMSLFTQNREIITLIQMVFILDIFLEIGRAFNMIHGNALKTSGDALYTVIVAVISMFVFAVGGTYIFGIALGMIVYGCYLAMSLDELFRALFVAFRWRSKKWMSKSIVKHDDNEILGEDIDTLLALEKQRIRKQHKKILYIKTK